MFPLLNPQVLRALQFYAQRPEPTEQPYDPSARMAQLFQPQTRTTDAYNQLINQYPEYQQPSMLRRIGAGLAGFGAGFRDPQAGIQVGYQLREQPNLERRQQWGERLKSLEPAMEAERYYNVNARQLAHQTIQGELTSRRLEEQERNNRERTRISDMRARAYDFKTRNPDWELQEVPGRNMQWVNPQTRQTADSGIPSGTLTETDKINLQGKNAIAAAKARSEGAEERQEQAAWGDPIQIEDETGKKTYVQTNRITGDVRPVKLPAGKASKIGTGTGAEGSPQGDRIALFNRASELANRPEYRDFIRIGTPGPNDFSLVPPKTGYFGSGPTPEVYKQIYRHIYGRDPDSIDTRGSSPAPVPSPAPAPSSTPPGRVRMLGKDGKYYTVPADKVEEAERVYGMKRQ